MLTCAVLYFAILVWRYIQAHQLSAQKAAAAVPASDTTSAKDIVGFVPDPRVLGAQLATILGE